MTLIQAATTMLLALALSAVLLFNGHGRLVSHALNTADARIVQPSQGPLVHSMGPLRQRRQLGTPSSFGTRFNISNNTYALALQSALCDNLFLGGYAARPDFPLTPDTNAYYLWTTFADLSVTPDWKVVAFSIRHSFPVARYFSVFLYNFQTGNVIGGWLDQRIRPDPGSINPFVDNGPGHNASQPQNYTLWMAPVPRNDSWLFPGLGGSPPNGDNYLSFQAVGSASLGLIFRLYLPDANLSDFPQYAIFPQILTYSLRSGRLRPCPRLVAAPPLTLISQLAQGRGNGIKLQTPSNYTEPENPDQPTIGFYRAQPKSIFADDAGDSAYLITMLNQSLTVGDGLVVMRVRIPRITPVPLSPRSTEQVRYFSICSAGPTLLSRVGSCLSDVQMLRRAKTEVDPVDGSLVQVATLFLAQNVSQYQNQAALAMNASLLELFQGGDNVQQTLLILRQKVIRSSFQSRSFQAVPVSAGLTGEDPDSQDALVVCPEPYCEASDYIGAWAPTARYCTWSRVLSGEGC